MANQAKDTAALEARIRELEQALAASAKRSGSTAPPITVSENALQGHFELLLGEACPEDILTSLQLLATQLGCPSLGLWSTDASVEHWSPIAATDDIDPPATDERQRSALLAGQSLTLADGRTLIPVAVRGRTSAVLLIAAGPAPEGELTSLARRASALMWEAYERGALLHQLRERDRRFRYAMEASRDGLWDWDLNQDKIYFSRGYLRMLGYDYERLPGTLDTLKHYFIHPDDLQEVMTEFAGAIANERDHLSLEHRLIHRDGQVVWTYCRCIFVERDEQGRPTRCVGTNTDITESVRNKAALEDARAEAEAASQTKSKFLASMSHEIRTPMNAIIGLSHLLQDTALDDLQQSYLNSIHSAANSLLQTVNQVFDYAKLESGNIILERSHFDLEQLFERLSRMFESSSLHKPVSIIFDIADDVPRFMRGDATRLSHIISHLVTNALQYSQSDEVVVKASTLKKRSERLTLQFSIIDFGRGLSPEALATLRSDLSRKPHTGGRSASGFGLQICKLLVGLMNGHLSIDSEPGKGATFAFTAEVETSQIGAQRIKSCNHSCRSLRLLVVDDNQLALDILAKSAGKLIDHVDTARDAQSALAKIRQAEQQARPYDLLLLDYKMPLKSGLEAAREIKTASDLEHKPKIFLVSSFQRDEIFSDHQDSRYVDDFLSKPVSESRLFDAICRALPECLSDDTPSSNDFANLKGAHVLLVEDNIVNQQVARGMMRKKGIIVTSAENGEQALDILRSGHTRFDAVLMDIEMPVLDGIAATRQIRAMEEFSALPIVAVTAQAMSGDRQSCLDAGMNEYISKPIKPVELYQTLSDLMGGRTIPQPSDV